ncbi:hypothetical protein [Methylorubrum extorquens]|uniref:Uncharacterized protein n=1 Tax=Methylorubrum extorquens DSM 13060 TaxID=882800 RepID=H1KRE1_METEX|nr:hypothetical protein [Methylorubrum extorquens]EHP89902.1 hypothetical protein MetexDRAFT_5204 [Methylorubrum extorquens DSM 13060]
MPPHTVELPPDRVLTPHWRCRDAALEDCGIGLGARQGNRNALASLVAAAGLAAETDQPWISFSRRRNWYAARSECGDLTYDNVIAAMKEGDEARLFEEDRALPGAHLDDIPRQSRFRATPLLIERLAGTRFRHIRPSSSIVMRDADGMPVAFAETDRTLRLRREADGLNEWLGGIRVEVSPDASPEDWQRTRHHLRARKVRDGRETWSYVLPTPTPHIVRVFGRGRWDCHGRLYGWWQSLPKDRRGDLLINGEFTIEPDFAMLHPTLLYAAVGATMPRDVYDTGEHERAHGKLALNILVNCRGGIGGAVDALMWRDDWEGTRAYTEGLVEAVASLNRPIAGFLGSDAGVRLMGVDSGMAVEVMKRCRKADIPCLPVHDSFRVPARSGTQVTAIMADVLDAARTRISQGTSKTSFQIIPQEPRSGAAAPAASPLPASSSAPALKEPAAKTAAKKAPGKAVSRPVQAASKAKARPTLPTVGEALPADWDLSERTLALVEHFQAVARARHRKVAAGAASGWGRAPTASERRLDLRQARQFAEVVAEVEQSMGVCDAAVPYRLSEEAKAKRERRLARETRRPGPPVRPRRPSTFWAKPQATPPKAQAKPQGTLF